MKVEGFTISFMHCNVKKNIWTNAVLTLAFTDIWKIFYTDIWQFSIEALHTLILSIIRRKKANLKIEVTRKQSTPNFPKNEHFLLPDMHTYVALKDLRKASERRFHSIILSPLRNIDTLGWLLLWRDYQCINQRWDINEFNWNTKASILFSELYIQNIYSLLISNHSFADFHKDFLWK